MQAFLRSGYLLPFDLPHWLLRSVLVMHSSLADTYSMKPFAGMNFQGMLSVQAHTERFFWTLAIPVMVCRAGPDVFTITLTIFD